MEDLIKIFQKKEQLFNKINLGNKDYNNYLYKKVLLRKNDKFFYFINLFTIKFIEN